MSKKKRPDSIPEEFASYDDAADFWDTHDTTHFPDAFQTVKLVSQFRGRHYEIEIEPDVLNTLRKRARQRGVTPGHLVSALLRQQLASSR